MQWLLNLLFDGLFLATLIMALFTGLSWWTQRRQNKVSALIWAIEENKAKIAEARGYRDYLGKYSDTTLGAITDIDDKKPTDINNYPKAEDKEGWFSPEAKAFLLDISEELDLDEIGYPDHMQHGKVDLNSVFRQFFVDIENLTNKNIPSENAKKNLVEHILYFERIINLYIDRLYDEVHIYTTKVKRLYLGRSKRK